MNTYDIIQSECVQDIIHMKQREELLAQHKFKIWQGANGKWYTYLPRDDGGRKQVRRNTKEEIEDVVVEFEKSHINNPTIDELFNEWNDRRLELKRISKSTHTKNISTYNRHFKKFGKNRIDDLSPEDFLNFLEGQIPKYNLTAKGFSALKSLVKGILLTSKRHKYTKYTAEDVFHDLDVSEREFKHSIKEDEEEVFSEREQQLITKYLISNQDIRNLAILLLFATGIRVGELVALKRQDIEDYRAVNIRRTETRYKGEDGKFHYEVKDFPKTQAGVRTVVVPSEDCWILRKLAENNPFGEYLIISNGKRMHTEAIRKRLYKICDKLHIYPKSPHKIRKTYGTILLDNGIDNRLILDQMGHASIGTTERHYHRNRRNIDAKQEILNEIDDLAITK